jgi:hypothetical protein
MFLVQITSWQLLMDLSFTFTPPLVCCRDLLILSIPEDHVFSAKNILAAIDGFKLYLYWLGC